MGFGCFITVIEPFEDKNMVECVMREDENTVEVRLKDKRVQKLMLSGVETGKSVISFREESDGKLVKEEIVG